jgi:exodeoxyribonuclease-5
MQRGLILHKLMEEILNGEVTDEAKALAARAGELIVSLGKAPVADPATGVSSAELAGCVARTLTLPQVIVLRPRFLPEFPVYGIAGNEDVESATAGIADALALADSGATDVLIDWKSDVNPSDATLDHCYSQVRAYLESSGAGAGLIVLTMSDRTIAVAASVQPVFIG